MSRAARRVTDLTFRDRHSATREICVNPKVPVRD
jgi:hypothetical protein